MFKSSFSIVRRPRRTQGSCGTQVELLQWDIMAAFSILWSRSTMPFASGMYAIVWWMEVPSSHPSCVQSCDVKEVPRSEVMCSGMPNLEIQPESRAAVQEAVVVSGIGTASGHLVDRSMMVKR